MRKNGWGGNRKLKPPRKSVLALVGVLSIVLAPPACAAKKREDVSSLTVHPHRRIAALAWPDKLSIMSASLAPECNEVKERYDNCFLKWYSEKFLRGTATSDECKPMFEQYEKCLSKALSERGIDKMLKEVRDDNRENDAAHMKPTR